MRNPPECEFCGCIIDGGYFGHDPECGAIARAWAHTLQAEVDRLRKKLGLPSDDEIPTVRGRKRRSQATITRIREGRES